MSVSAAKPVIGQLKGIFFPSEPINRAEFARLIVYFSGFLAGLAVAQLDELSPYKAERASEITLALTAIFSVFVVIHTLAHVAGDREQISKVCAKAAIAALFGAAGVAGAVFTWAGGAALSLLT